MHLYYFTQTGLAVEDVQKLQREAKKTRIKLKVSVFETLLTCIIIVVEFYMF